MTAFHLCLAAPAGDTAALSVLDPALHLKAALEAAGVPVTLGRHRLRADAVNLVFGAHHGVDPHELAAHTTLLVNLEPLGAGGTPVPPQTLRLLREFPVVEIDAANVAAYRDEAAANAPPVSLLRFGAQAAAAPPLEGRPLDLLFLGALTPRRVALLQRIEAQGLRIARFETPLFGPEREAFLRSARAVLLLNADEASRFDTATAAMVLAAGTPLIAERVRGPAPDAVYGESVHWLDPDQIEPFFGTHFKTPAFAQEAARALQHHAAQDTGADVARLVALGTALHARARPVPAPRRLNADMAAQGWRTGWLNVAARANAGPDAVLDLAAPGALDHPALAPLAGTLQAVQAGAVDPASDAGARLLDHALALLATGGTLVLRLAAPPGMPPDAARARAALADASTAFWRSGWFTHRFRVEHVGALDDAGRPAASTAATAWRVALTKVETSFPERTAARAASDGFGLVRAG